MVLITRGATNTIDLTLTENVTLSNPYYLFVFTNKQTGKVSKCNLTDSSLYPERYNRFTFVEPTDAELIPNDYVLQVYEVATQTTTIPSTGMLETDIVRVSIDPLSETEFVSDETTAPLVYESTD